ncbi:MAG: hypothetical protein WCW52_01765 [Elusimicrobiales bacterium]|jgi:hypothetical protein
MRNAFVAAVVSVVLTGAAFAGTGMETAKSGADALMEKLQNAGAAAVGSAEFSSARLPEPSARTAEHDPELVKSLMVDVIEVRAAGPEDALKKFAEIRQNLADAGFSYVIGAIDGGALVRIAYVVTKYVPVDLPVMQTIRIVSGESRAAIDKKLMEAKANLAKAGLFYIAAEVVQDPKYDDGWYDVDITYARS